MADDESVAKPEVDLEVADDVEGDVVLAGDDVIIESTLNVPRLAIWGGLAALLAIAVALLTLVASGLVLPLLSDIPSAPLQAQPADWPELRSGEEGAEVVVLQYLLRAEGYALDVDGDFDQQTLDAVMQFQSDRDLTVDGMVGGFETWPALVEDHSVQQGSADGDAVRAVQHALSDKHGYGIPVDGDFGPVTDAAVRDFQQRAGITVNGLVGPETWRYLLARN